MINGFEYAWEDVKVIIPGSVLPEDGVVAIKYKYAKEHTNIHARGAKAISMGRGKETPTASVTLLQSTVEKMISGLPPGKNLTHMAPFTITVAYAPTGGTFVIDHLLYCRVMDFEKGMKTGDGNMTVDCELAVGDILYNI